MQDAPTWDLESICPGGPGGDAFRTRSSAATARLSTLHDEVRALEPLASDPQGWASLINRLDPITDAVAQLSSFAGCAAAADSRGRAARSAEAAADELERAVSAIMVDVEASLSEASPAVFDPWVARDDLVNSRPWLEDVRRGRTLRLGRDQQALKVAMDREAIQGWGRLYDLLSGDLTATLQTAEGSRRLGVAELGAMRADPDPKVRRAAHEAGGEAWSGVREICAHTLTQITGARQQFHERVGCDELASSLHDNRMSPATLEALWAACDAVRPSLVRYLERKAKLLGKPHLDWWDRDAPLPTADGAGTLSWQGTTEIILDAFEGFHPEVSDFARHALERKWVDAAPREGRRPGGFCTDLPESGESRIFMTFTGSMDNGMTLAHELGHAWHNEVLTAVPSSRRHLTSALAETASTFAEAAFRDRVLDSATDNDYRAFMLDQELQAAVAFCMDIPARFQFERRLFALRRDGMLDAEQLSEEMVTAQRAAYGGALGSYSPLFWCSKLHFYIPEFGFYNWPYTFGYLFSAAVYARAKAEGPAFLGTLKDLLRRTGWQQSEALAQDTLGVDLTDPAFWIETAKPVTERVDAFLAATA